MNSDTFILTEMTLHRLSNSYVDLVQQESWAARIRSYPEKVIQFGSGVLLRGLPDYFIDKANKQGVFEGRILVVKTTQSGSAETFAHQDGLYTQIVRGWEGGKTLEEVIVNASISRVLNAQNQWENILLSAQQPELKLVISNTTEVGIRYQPESFHQGVPASYPGKLLAFLYRRFLHFKGNPAYGLVILPTELIPENGTRLKEIVLQLAGENFPDRGFLHWLTSDNFFCNTLVDRIVPGKLPQEEHRKLEDRLGYKDDLMIMSEAYRLWAIECKEPAVRELLSFAQTDSGVIIAPAILKYRELKIRLLNAPHTFSCGLAHLAGFTTVKQAMQHPGFISFLEQLMLRDIVPLLQEESIPVDEARSFALQTLDRFNNPFLEHRWLSISLQYTSKVVMRTLPLIVKPGQRGSPIPQTFCIGFAAFLLFMKGEKQADGKYYGVLNGSSYLIEDEQAAFFSEAWKTYSGEALVQYVCRQHSIWGTNLTQVTGLADSIHQELTALQRKGALAVLQNFNPA